MSGEALSAVEGEIPRWTVESGEITFQVTSDGTTGPAWIERLHKRGFLTSEPSMNFLRSAHFVPTVDVTTTVRVMRGREERSGKMHPVVERVPDKAVPWSLVAPEPEVACLIRVQFSDDDLKQMGFVRIVVVHNHRREFATGWPLLCVKRDPVGSWLVAAHGSITGTWPRETGFAFAVPEPRRR